jgi:hypothetical protein
MKYAILVQTITLEPVEIELAEGQEAPPPVEVTRWTDTGEVFEEKPAPERTLGGRLLELEHLTGAPHAAQVIPEVEA